MGVASQHNFGQRNKAYYQHKKFALLAFFFRWQFLVGEVLRW